jgi:hypothetical protein
LGFTPEPAAPRTGGTAGGSLHNLTVRVVECPAGEMNRSRASVGPPLRVPPTEAEVAQLFARWREELATCRKFAPGRL